MNQVGEKALTTNATLQPLAFLIGRWRTEGTHPQMAGQALHGLTTFDWHEGGAFIVMRSQIDRPEFPDGVAIIGSDNSSGGFAMAYFDERGVSRLLQVEAGDRQVTWRHEDRELAQTLKLTARDSGDEMVSIGRMSQKGGRWTDDLSQVFKRER